MKEYQTYSLIRKYPHGALMARILHDGSKNEEWQFVGESKRIVAERSGVLELMVNDGDPGNNYGAYTVSVSLNSNRGKDDEDEKEKASTKKESAASPKKSKQENQSQNDDNKPDDSTVKRKLKNIWNKIKKP